MDQFEKSKRVPNTLPDDSAWLFPEYDFKTIELESHKGVIIERILEKGSWEQVRWLFKTYGDEEVKSWVRQHGFRLLSKRSFALWSLVLDVEDYHAPAWAVEAKEMEPWRASTNQPSPQDLAEFYNISEEKGTSIRFI